jgi:galactokinase
VTTFEDCFGAPAAAIGRAPGRVNLLGEHTDYNEGFVLPASISQQTRVAIGFARDAEFMLYSANLDRMARWRAGAAPAEEFAKYVYGCIVEASDGRAAVPPLAMHVASEVPIGVGLSSSAALEVATLRALRELMGYAIDDVEIARLGQRAEIRHAGVNCGLLDQMACSFLTPGRMLFLDTRTLERQLLPLPAGCELLVVDSGLPRSLAASKYNERRQQCEQAARMLGVASLRDVHNEADLAHLPVMLQKRARHVVRENARVQCAIDASAEEFGRCMSASHRSLAQDYEVSVPALDSLVDLMQAEPTVLGAKLTGAGFGGACVALCRADTAADSGGRVVTRYNALGHAGKMVVPVL